MKFGSVDMNEDERSSELIDSGYSKMMRVTD